MPIVEVDGKPVLVNGKAIEVSYGAVWGEITGDITDQTDLAAALNAKADKPVIKTAMDSVAVANTQYFLGTQSAVSVVLPSTAQAGDTIIVVWYNGTTAATLSVTGTVLTVDYTPSANSRSELNAMFDGTYWAVVTNEQAVTA